MEKTGIIWTEKTAVVDRGGKRIRHYTRKVPGPPKMLRKQMLILGYAWCSGCMDWVLSSDYRKGLCRIHRNELYRRSYKKSNAIKLQKRARKRNLLPVSEDYINYVFRLFDGRCVYCGKPANTIDHVLPVKLNGNNTPDNLLPACNHCNSSKKDRHPSQVTFIVDITDIICPTLTRSGNFHILNQFN